MRAGAWRGIAGRHLLAGAACLILAQLAASWAGRLRVGDAEQVKLGAVLTELPPGEFAGTMLLGGLRGLVIDLLWMRAIGAKDDGRHHESLALSQLITRVQPRFEQVWEFIGHDLAYNIAAQHEDRADKWNWYRVGMQSLARGATRNPESSRLLRNWAWMVLHRGSDFPAEHGQADWSADLAALFTAAWPGGPFIQGDGQGDGTAFAWHWDGPEPAEGTPLLAYREGALVGRGAWRSRTVIWDGAAPAAGSFTLVESLSAPLLSARLYARSWQLSDPELRTRTSHVIRFLAINLDREAARERALGRHRRTLELELASLARWQEAIAWGLDPASGLEPEVLDIHLEACFRNEGRCRERAAWLAVQLATDPIQGAQLAAAIRERRVEEAERLLATGSWHESVPARAGVRWYEDEAAP